MHVPDDRAFGLVRAARALARRPFGAGCGGGRINGQRDDPHAALTAAEPVPRVRGACAFGLVGGGSIPQRRGPSRRASLADRQSGEAFRGAAHGVGAGPLRDTVNMEKKRIGSLEVPVVGIGCNNFGWRIDASGAAAVVDAALDAGVGFFDTADIYGEGRSEEFLGRALGKRRNEAIIATKFGMKMDDQRVGAHPEYVARAIEDSLRQARHRPHRSLPASQPDPPCPSRIPWERSTALWVPARRVRSDARIFRPTRSARRNRLRAAGRDLSACKTSTASLTASLRLACSPNVYGWGWFLPYFPLANGLLTGKYRLGKPLPAGTRGGDAFGPKLFTERNLQVVEGLIGFAQSRSHTLLELAISWLGQRAAVASVIAGIRHG